MDDVCWAVLQRVVSSVDLCPLSPWSGEVPEAAI